AEHLHDRARCRALFATHYHELAQLADALPGLRNYNVQIREGGDDIIFLHKIAPGSADKSYGLHVARLAGVPREVLDRAGQVLAALEARPMNRKALAAAKPVPKKHAAVVRAKSLQRRDSVA